MKLKFLLIIQHALCYSINNASHTLFFYFLSEYAVLSLDLLNNSMCKKCQYFYESINTQK